MNPIHPMPATRRSAFTLIELLVVIAIIAILGGLLLGGVMYVFRATPAVQTRNDISQLDIALKRFKAEYHFYPPSTMKLCSNYAAYDQSQALDRRSLQWISKIWPSLGKPANFTAVNWANRSPAPTAGSPSIDILDGDQCLVFFLGGPPQVAGQPALMGGFSNNPLNPVSAANPPLKRWFDFDNGRLFNRSGNAFPSFADVFGKTPPQPYVYFSSQNVSDRDNGYDTGPNGLGVRPYFRQAAPLAFHNPSTFQIICAGEDGQFGAGGIWPFPPPPFNPPPGTMDDYTNFHDKKLGVP